MPPWGVVLRIEMRWVKCFNIGPDYFVHIPSVTADTTVEEALSVDTIPPHFPLRGWATGVPCDTAGLPARLK